MIKMDFDNYLEDFIQSGFEEDLRGIGDITGQATIDPSSTTKARLLVKDKGVLAGVDVAKAIFRKADPTFRMDIRLEDGANIEYGNEAFYVECNTQALLKAERLVLNTMQRMSGIATLSRRFADEVADLPVTILDTRKTTPLLRHLEKWAVRIGGCTNYRDGLYDWYMIKDNHVDAAGSISKALKRVLDHQAKNGTNKGITVEVRNLQNIKDILAIGGMTRIMLDNFRLDQMRRAVALINGRYEVEASGGVNLRRLRRIAETGVQFISSGALTHSYQSLDMSLKVMKE